MPPIETTSAAETPLRPAARVTQRVTRALIGPPQCALVAPLVNYIWTLHQQRPDLTLTVAVPEIVARHWWHRILHDRIARRLRRTLDALPGVVVTSVPFHLARE